MVTYVLLGVLAFIALAALAIAFSSSSRATELVYGASLAVASALCICGLIALLGPRGAASTTTLPLGLPWLGAHFRRGGEPFRARLRPA